MISIDKNSEFDTEDSVVMDDSDLELEERHSLYKIRQMRRRNRNFEKILKQIRDPKAIHFRRCSRKPKIDENGNKVFTKQMHIPLEQVKNDYILSQSVIQREIIYNASVLSIDQLHSKAQVSKNCARAVHIRSQDQEDEWHATGNVAMRNKTENAHRFILTVRIAMWKLYLGMNVQNCGIIKVMNNQILYSLSGTIERWSDVAKKTERLVANRQEELAFGASPKKKRPKLMAYDNRIKATIKKHQQGKIDLEEYWETILQLKLDFGIEIYK